MVINKAKVGGGGIKPVAKPMTAIPATAAVVKDKPKKEDVKPKTSG